MKRFLEELTVFILVFKRKHVIEELNDVHQGCDALK